MYENESKPFHLIVFTFTIVVGLPSSLDISGAQPNLVLQNVYEVQDEEETTKHCESFWFLNHFIVITTFFSINDAASLFEYKTEHPIPCCTKV